MSILGDSLSIINIFIQFSLILHYKVLNAFYKQALKYVRSIIFSIMNFLMESSALFLIRCFKDKYSEPILLLQLLIRFS